MMANRPRALIIVTVLTLLALSADLLTVVPPIRIASGLLLVFFLPGFSVVSATYPRAELSRAELALSGVASSVALTTLSAVSLGATIGLTQESILVVLAIISLGASVVAYVRASRHAEVENGHLRDHART